MKTHHLKFAFHTILRRILSFCSSFKCKVYETLKHFGFIFIILPFAFVSKAQPPNCIFKPSQYTIHFGRGNVKDLTRPGLSYYERVTNSCPTDGHYSYASYTQACFRDDWHTLLEDHTPGDVDGNMLLVNAGPRGGVFLSTSFGGLKSNTTYELGVWLMNLCRPTKKCPFLLLPSLNIRLETPDGKFIADMVTKDLPRVDEPRWAQHRVYFTTPASISTAILFMTNNAPSGCGNDFAVDDITIRECVKQDPKPTAAPTTKPPAKPSAVKKTPSKKVTATPPKKVNPSQVIKPQRDTASKTIAALKQPPKIFPPPPLVLKTRENALVRKIETNAGEIKINIYDNGEIDGDTVSIYHNNILIRSHIRLSQKPISFSIGLNPSQPHHELIMVAENLGSIPPNTSVMIITTPANRYEVFISSSEQKNAKVVFDLKK
ncbi:hypothetical protein [Terrimonas pollutisoli]|uniref:hypothetical protein n=1 Tax=Terrimonas pollutisoli TaxID=3034147 RepID=UPI0023EBA615|nr:hypothetical protein [Terrimonas sp. H1YJ31]